MASHLPVATTRVGDVEHILGEAQRPYTSPLEEGASGLRDALRALATDPSLRQNLGRLNALRVSEEFTHANMVEQHAALWRSGVEATA